MAFVFGVGPGGAYSEGAVNTNFMYSALIEGHIENKA